MGRAVPDTQTPKGVKNVLYRCVVCGDDMGWDRPSGVCSEACLYRGQGFEPPVRKVPCPACGEEHGPPECRAQLATRLAESINDHTEEIKENASLRLDLQQLTQRVSAMEAEMRRL